MANKVHPSLSELMLRLRWPLSLTWAGLIAERLVRAFWPLWSLLAIVAALLMLGFQDLAPIEVVWSTGMLAALLLVLSAGWGAARFRFPRRIEALTRLDQTLPGRPLSTLGDVQAIGVADSGSEALWRAHLARMADSAASARAVEPDLSLSRQDPFGLRYIALLGLVVALLFGSFWRVGSGGQHLPENGGAMPMAQGPLWEGWIEPPGYTGLPTLYLADQKARLRTPAGSQVTLMFYGEPGLLSLAETVSGRTDGLGAATDSEQRFEIMQSGEIQINGPGERNWFIEAVPDGPPSVSLLENGARTAFDGQMSLPFEARDDYGVTGGEAIFTLDIARVDRRYGLALPPETRAPIRLGLPMPLVGGRTHFTETLIENLSDHPWEHMPVSVQLRVEDASGLQGFSEPVEMVLPARKFFNPMATAIVEQRRDLLWSRENVDRVARILRAISFRPDPGLFRPDAAYLRLRVILRRMESMNSNDGLDDMERDEIALALWNLALLLEDGDMGDALARMRAAQERLSEAMKNGATQEEIARLMQELRDATQDYLRQKVQQAQKGDPDGQDQRNAETMMELTELDLQAMMDRIQELMDQGRFAEAQQALEEFQKMMENMQVTQGPGQRSTTPGQNSMDGLAETLRQQQGLSDQAFRDLQDQFNSGGNQDMPLGNQGRNGGQGDGRSEDGQDGQAGGGRPGERPGQSGEQGQRQSADGQGSGGGLAERQEALRRELERQRQGLPQLGGEAGEAARELLERAEEAMGRAEEALRGDDLAGAIDNQADAIEALREGIRNMGEAMAQERSPNSRGEANGRAAAQAGGSQSDPLGRATGQTRRAGTDMNLLQGEDVYRRARDLLDEIRRRSGESIRPEAERNYLERLLDRF